jgi:hypothetical protein
MRRTDMTNACKKQLMPGATGRLNHFPHTVLKE